MLLKRNGQVGLEPTFEIQCNLQPSVQFSSVVQYLYAGSRQQTGHSSLAYKPYQLFNIYMQAAGSRQQAGHSSLAYKPYAYAYAYAYVNRFTPTPGAASIVSDNFKSV